MKKQASGISFPYIYSLSWWIERLRLHYNENENQILYADVIISCVLPVFLFIIIVVDDEMEATSRSS